jgi:hypothetical protein
VTFRCYSRCLALCIRDGRSNRLPLRWSRIAQSETIHLGIIAAISSD